MKHNIKRVLLALILLSAVIFAANIPSSIIVGVDGHYRQIKMPLYVKWTEFLARHYEYARLAREITAGRETDEEKSLAILAWTRANIKDSLPGMPEYDDHILSIIIRGYGIPEQFQDVFTTLCAYAGMPAFWDKFYDKGRTVKYAISFVKIGGRWLVFDAYRGVSFRKADGSIADIGDILKDNSLVRGPAVDRVTINGVPYREFYEGMSLAWLEKGLTLRPYRQMPFRRFIYEIRKTLGIERDPVRTKPVSET